MSYSHMRRGQNIRLRHKGGRGLRQRLIGQGEEERNEDSDEEYVTLSMWKNAQRCFGVIGVALAIVSILLIALWVWWLIFWDVNYQDIREDIHEIKKDCCDEEYNASVNLCTDTGLYVDFSCYNDTLCTGLAEQNTSIGCLGDVNITSPQDGDIINWNSTTEQWENEQCDPCTNGTDGADCWDINGNGLCDMQIEDVNDDGVCNQTDCIGEKGEDGLDGANATIDECDKPFGELRYANGTSPADSSPFVMTFGLADTWTDPAGLVCDTVQDHFINATEAGCFFTVLKNDSYKVELDISLVTRMPPGTEIWVGVAINGVDPELFNSFNVFSGDSETISYTLALDLLAGDNISFAFYSTNTSGSLDVDRIQFTAVGELLCGFDVTGPKGDKGEKGDQGDDGFHCWDLNENYFCDIAEEDINGDGLCNVSDCTLSNITYDIITGDLCAELGDESIDCLSDVTTTDPTNDQILVYESGQWTNKDQVVESMDFDCNATEPPCDCGTENCTAGTTWFNPEDGVQYYCDCEPGNRWLHVGPAHMIEGENAGTCSNNLLASQGCAAQFGGSLGADVSSIDGDLAQPHTGLFMPYDITIVAAGFSYSDFNFVCGEGGNVTMHVCWSPNNQTDDAFIMDNCTMLDGLIISNTESLKYFKGDRIDIPGERYLIWGLMNTCDPNIAEWNLVLYYKQRYETI